jgi:AAA+ ATPase superfamily predicted ATPase
MMQNEILNYSAPLYGRASLIIKLAPLAFKHVSKLVPKLKFVDKLCVYFIFRGIPAYYVNLTDYKSFYEILKFVLRNGSTFYSEVSLMLSEEVKNDTKFAEIISLIAEGVNKPGEIASKAHLLPGNLYYYINIIGNLEIIVKELPVTEEQKERSKRVSYIVKNPFVIFWAQVIKPLLSQIERNDFDTAYEDANIRLEHIYQKRFEVFAAELLSYAPISGIRFTKIGRLWATI